MLHSMFSVYGIIAQRTLDNEHDITKFIKLDNNFLKIVYQVGINICNYVISDFIHVFINVSRNYSTNIRNNC